MSNSNGSPVHLRRITCPPPEDHLSGGSPVHLRSKHQVLVGKTRWVKQKKEQIYEQQQ